MSSDIQRKRIDLTSGFTISVQPLPPYYADFIEDAYPYAEYPKRKLTLAGGDILEIDYSPPENPPDVTDTDEYELYIEWFSTKSLNDEITLKRERAKRDFLLASCVTIDHGPIDMSDDSWVTMLEAAFDNYVIPTHVGKRMLAFLKSCVIRTTSEYNRVMQAAMFPEVTMQGITTALRGFPDTVGQPRPGRRHRGKAKQP